MAESKHSHVYKHFEKAIELVAQYTFDEPLHFYLKKYFSENKKHGSKDRKTISHFCYTFFRIGKNVNDRSAEENLRIALFLCEDSLDAYAPVFTDNFLINHTGNLNERIVFIQKKYPEFSLDHIFPFKDELSGGMDISAFQASFLIQPKVFLRIRKNLTKTVEDKLRKASVPFGKISDDALSVPQNTGLDKILALDKEVVVQDLSSQKTADFLHLVKSGKSAAPLQIWDCCAASGGKSILAKDVFGNVNLTVSDIRPQILQNLQSRFREAGIHSFKSFVADLSKPAEIKETFDLIICDAPCSGSGTWSRTPEMLTVFDKKEISGYQKLQQAILQNAIPHLRKNGFFLYITCSVFEKENEDAVKYITEHFPLTCIKSEPIKGYAQQADSMYAALFTSKK